MSETIAKPPFAERHPDFVRGTRYVAWTGVSLLVLSAFNGAAHTFAPQLFASPNTNLAQKVGRAYSPIVIAGLLISREYAGLAGKMQPR